MATAKKNTEDAGVVPGTDAPAVDPVADSKAGPDAPEPQVKPADWPDDPELNSQDDFEKVEINKAVTEYGLHADHSIFGKGGAQSHARDDK